MSLGGRYTFEFTAGEQASLRMLPIPDPVRGYPYGEDPAGPRDWNSLLGSDLTDDMLAKLEGLRIALYVILGGSIVESNAAYPSDRHPNVLTILDLPFDQILADPAAQEAIKQTGPDVRQVLSDLDVRGVRIEEAGKTIDVRFQ